MSSSALVLLSCLAISVLTFLFSSGWLEIAARAASIMLTVLFLIAVAAGRRFKFDPVLR
jgi:hypothetical protein